MSFTQILTGGNNSQSKDVIRATFSTALVTVPTLEAYDDTNYTTSKEIFSGTTNDGDASNVKGLLYATQTVGEAETTPLGPTSADWVSLVRTAVASDPLLGAGGGLVYGGNVLKGNKLKGSSKYLYLSNSVPAALGNVYFNTSIRMPYDATPGINAYSHILVIRMAYTGAEPSVTLAYRSVESPVTYATFNPASLTLYHADAGVSDPNIVLLRPASPNISTSQSLWLG